MWIVIIFPIFPEKWSINLANYFAVFDYLGWKQFLKDQSTSACCLVSSLLQKRKKYREIVAAFISSFCFIINKWIFYFIFRSRWYFVSLQLGHQSFLSQKYTRWVKTLLIFRCFMIYEEFIVHKCWRACKFENLATRLHAAPSANWRKPNC